MITEEEKEILQKAREIPHSDPGPEILNSKSYPYMTYDDEAKAIYLGMRVGTYFQSKMVAEDYYTKDHMINIDYDKDNNILGIEIILPQSYNTNKK